MTHRDVINGKSGDRFTEGERIGDVATRDIGYSSRLIVGNNNTRRNAINFHETGPSGLVTCTISYLQGNAVSALC